MRASRQRVKQQIDEAKRKEAAAIRQQQRLVRDTIDRLAETLGETDERQRRQMTRVVETLGVPYALELLDETMQIEAAGGMMTADGARRRSPGGAFLTLLKQRLTAEGRKEDLKKIL